MSALALCAACEFGDHDRHVAWPVRPPEGGVGGVHCPCPGGCEPQANPLIDALAGALKKARDTRPLPPAEPITMSGYGSGEAAPPRPHEITREREPNQSRFACTCGRFIPESAIRYEDVRDDSTFYGIRSEVEWDCSRCGTVKGEGAWEPPLVTFPARVLPPDEAPCVPLSAGGSNE